MNLLQKSQYSWNLLFFRKIIRVLLELFRRRTQNFTIIDQEKYKNMQILIYVISMEFLSQRRQRPSCLTKSPSRREARKDDCILRIENPLNIQSKMFKVSLLSVSGHLLSHFHSDVFITRL